MSIPNYFCNNIFKKEEHKGQILKTYDEKDSCNLKSIRELLIDAHRHI